MWELIAAYWMLMGLFCTELLDRKRGRRGVTKTDVAVCFVIMPPLAPFMIILGIIYAAYSILTGR